MQSVCVSRDAVQQTVRVCAHVQVLCVVCVCAVYCRSKGARAHLHSLSKRGICVCPDTAD